jgi:signal transduction histidine kinase/DNA-binding response OmpR family regulator
MADISNLTSSNHDKENKINLDSYLWIEKEKARLQNILDYNINEIKDNDEGLVCIARLAAYICNTPCGAVDIVNYDTLDFIGRYGFDFPCAERKPSLCTIAIEQDEVFEVEDTLGDHRFVENKFVNAKENALRFYAGHPLKTKEGYNIGAVCVFDTKPKKLNDNQKDALKTLSIQVVNFLDLKRQNKSLLAANALSEKLSKAKDEFFSNVSHELRTPLNAINGYAEILSKCQLTDEQMEAVNIIRSSSDILINMINEILDFSKINSGKLKIEYLPFDMFKTVKLVYDLLSKKAQQKGLDFTLNYDERIPSVIIGDKVRINQIIMNLVGNAIKFTEKGYVRIDVSLIEESAFYVTIQFSIKDTGIGIEEEKLMSIFNRFEQAEGNATFRHFGGTGLGLNISKNLVELQDGKLNVKSIFGQGSDFYFQLKFGIPTDPIITKTDIKSINYSLLENLKVLVCEDNPINVKLIELILKNKVSEISFAENGLIAIEILKNKSFDVILMDIHMPVKDGIETTGYIRENLKLDIPILGHTANATASERELSYKKGMNDYFLKTFVPQDIYEKISKNVQEYRKKKRINNRLEILNSRKRRSKSNVCTFLPDDDSSKNVDPKKSKSKSHFKTQTLEKGNKNKSLYFVKTPSTEVEILENTENDNPTGNSGYPAIDHINLKILAEYSGGDQEFERQFIEIFLEKFPKDVKSLENDVQAENFSQICFWVHKMKSPLLMLGLFHLKEQLENLKTLASSHDNKVKLKEETKNFNKNIDYIYLELNQLLNKIKIQ